MSKCLSFEIYKVKRMLRNIYISNDDLNAEILKNILRCNAILEENFF